MTITAIGFANKYYTLWNITEESKPLGNGRDYVITHYIYIKNISFDKETALAKYPNATFDENLRGKTQSWNTEKEVWNNVDVFRFGKYKYENIIKINDIDYTVWYWEKIMDKDQKEFISQFLKDNGYEIRTNTYTDYYGETHTDEYLVSPDELELERKNNEAFNEIETKLNNGETIEFIPECNPDELGDCRIGNIIYHFKEVKENYYQGWTYYLPVVNGKQKRIKNKKITVTKYTYTRNESIITINIENFTINK